MGPPVALSPNSGGNKLSPCNLKDKGRERGDQTKNVHQSAPVLQEKTLKKKTLRLQALEFGKSRGNVPEREVLAHSKQEGVM